MESYPHDVVVALIVKYANDFGVLNSKEKIKKTDNFIKEYLGNNSLIKEKNNDGSKRGRPYDIDVDLQLHLIENLNNHIWRDNEGHEKSIHEMERSRVVHLYNDLITGRFSVLYQDSWERILLNNLTPIT